MIGLLDRNTQCVGYLMMPSCHRLSCCSRSPLILMTVALSVMASFCVETTHKVKHKVRKHHIPFLSFLSFFYKTLSTYRMEGMPKRAYPP